MGWGAGRSPGSGRGAQKGRGPPPHAATPSPRPAAAPRGAGAKGAADGSREGARARGEALAGGRAVWNFAYGANINPWKLETKRGMKPLETARGVLDGWRLLFNHRGGMGNVEPLGDRHGPGPAGVHGMLLLLSAGDFATLCGMEHQYDPTEVRVRAYDGREIDAFAFVSMPAFRTLAQDLAAPERYMQLLRDGARTSGLDAAYAAWLCGLPSIRGERGPEYYRVEGPRGDASPPGRGAGSGGGPPARARRGRSPSPGGVGGLLGAPTGVFAAGDSVYVADSKGDRVLRFPRPEAAGARPWSLGAAGEGGEMVAGGRGRGAGPCQLHRPFRVFADDAGTVFVVDRNNARVTRWDPGGRSGVVVAGGGRPGGGLGQLDQPSGVFVHRGSVYVSDRANHRVMRWDTGAREGVVVAGGRGFGGRSDQLACPAAVVVTEDGTVLVADEANDRVQAWPSGATEGVTVAGGTAPGGGAGELYHPLGLCLGGAGGPTPELFVADSLNYRVQRAPLPAACRDQAQPPALGYAGTTVAGGLGLGPGPEQLGQPVSVCLDDRGVLYVADADNGRVQVVPPAAQRAASERRPPASTLDDAQRTLTAGVVTEFREGPGFGFIKAAGKRYFAHHSDIRLEVRRGYPALRKGDLVEFFPRPDEKWGQRAAMVRTFSPA